MKCEVGKEYDVTSLIDRFMHFETAEGKILEPSYRRIGSYFSGTGKRGRYRGPWAGDGVEPVFEDDPVENEIDPRPSIVVA